VLGKDVFEYDVILKKAPVSNIVSLTLEGAENFDFFRQPVSRKNPLLSGSYAVYLKQVLTGQGTGKLCHIYRPEIIDASGRRVWGDLSVSGDKLLITIPENWLASAVYPVLVDPVVGCSAIGTRTVWDPWNEEDEDMGFAEFIVLNKYTASATINGRCTAFFYDRSKYRNIPWSGYDFPVIYSDSGNCPKYKKTSNEKSLFYPATNNAPTGWLGAEFTVKDSVPAGAAFWFGLFAAGGWNTCYDLGGDLFVGYMDYDYFINGIDHEEYPSDLIKYGRRYNIKLSMYFEFSQAQSYIRSITAGVCLSDSASKRIDFRRGLAAAVKVTECNVKRFLCLVRSIRDSAAVLFSLPHSISFGRFISSAVNVVSGGAKFSLLFFVKIADAVFSGASLSRRLSAFIRIVTLVSVRDYFIRRFLSGGSKLTIKSVITREIVIESKI
jgi:hypothetical protein